MDQFLDYLPKNQLHMKHLLFTILSFCWISTTFGIEQYTAGESLHIWAISGLNMRATPDAQGEKVLNLPYGATVKVVDTQPYANPFSYAMVKSEGFGTPVNWVVDGYWVQVEYQGQEGYVFDGYLGKLPVCSDEPEKHPYFNLDLFKEYGAAHWGGLKEERKETVIDLEMADPDKGRTDTYQITFKNGGYVEDIEEGYSGYITLLIKDISLEEGYLFFNALTGFEYKQKKHSGSNAWGMRLSSQKPNELFFMSEGGGSIQIQKVADGVMIQMGGGC